MNIINFLKPFTESHATELRIWHWISITTIGTWCVIIIVCSTLQYSTYRNLTHEKRAREQEVVSWNKSLEQKRVQCAEQEQLEKQIQRLYIYQTAPKNPHNLLNHIQMLVGPALLAFTVEKNGIELQLTCHDAHESTLFLQRLRSTPYLRNVHLRSLQTGKQRIASFRAIINTTLTNSLL